MATAAVFPPVGSELRRWREHRSLSQLALAHRAEVSSRHLSFVETGRSRPTPDMILRLAAVMEVPLADQNRLLLAGGFAPRHAQRDTDDTVLAPVMAGLRSLLDAHSPYPALLLDDHWDVIDANAAVDTLVVGADPELLAPPLNVLRLSLHPRGVAPRIRNLGTWRRHLLHQLDQRIAHTAGDPALVSLREEVRGYPYEGPPGEPAPVDPVLLLELEDGDRVLRMFSTTSRVVGASDVTLDGLHLETFVPADQLTRRHLARASADDA